MDILITHPLADDLVRRIRAAAPADEVVVARTDAERAAAVPRAEVVLGGLGDDDLRRAVRLRWIQSLSAGVDTLLTPALLERDLRLTSAKGVVGVHLAEHAFALLLALTRGIAVSLRRRTWDAKWPTRAGLRELAGGTMGIVGLGGTGRELAARAAAFGMRVIAVDPEAVEVPAGVAECGRMDRFDDLLERSDVVAICAPLTPATEGLFDRRAFRRMRPGAILVNVTRGRIVDEAALLEALREGWIAGAALDVVPTEPLPDDHPLWGFDNVVLTPHTAGASPAREGRSVDQFLANLERFRAGRPLIGEYDRAKGY